MKTRKKPTKPLTILRALWQVCIEIPAEIIWHKLTKKGK